MRPKMPPEPGHGLTWLFNEAEDRWDLVTISGDFIHMSNNHVRLDGHFTIEQLEAIIQYAKDRQGGQA